MSVASHFFGVAFFENLLRQRNHVLIRLSAFYVVVGSSFVDSKFHKYAVNISVKTATTPSLYKVVTYISFVFKLGILGQHFLDCFYKIAIKRTYVIPRKILRL